MVFTALSIYLLLQKIACLVKFCILFVSSVTHPESMSTCEQTFGNYGNLKGLLSHCSGL